MAQVHLNNLGNYFHHFARRKIKGQSENDPETGIFLLEEKMSEFTLNFVQSTDYILNVVSARHDSGSDLAYDSDEEEVEEPKTYMEKLKAKVKNPFSSRKDK